MNSFYAKNGAKMSIQILVTHWKGKDNNNVEFKIDAKNENGILIGMCSYHKNYGEVCHFLHC